MTNRSPDPRIPGFLGRALDVRGVPVGTCFQERPGILVTAFHVLQDARKYGHQSAFLIDALNGATEPIEAEAVAFDEDRDLAVLRTEQPLPESIIGILPTDFVRLDER